MKQREKKQNTETENEATKEQKRNAGRCLELMRHL